MPNPLAVAMKRAAAEERQGEALALIAAELVKVRVVLEQLVTAQKGGKQKAKK